MFYFISPTPSLALCNFIFRSFLCFPSVEEEEEEEKTPQLLLLLLLLCKLLQCSRQGWNKRTRNIDIPKPSRRRRRHTQRREKKDFRPNGLLWPFFQQQKRNMDFRPLLEHFFYILSFNRFFSELFEL